MHQNIKIFKRCCFCLPLRHGLLAWGYVKMALLLYLIVYLVNDLKHHPDPFSNVWLIVIFVVIIIETIFNLLLLIAAHIKSNKLLKIYYLFVILESTAIVFLVAFLAFMRLYWFPHVKDKLNVVTQVIDLMGFLLLDFYFMLLVRSEVKKLESENLTCSFVNNEAELKCDINKIIPPI